MLTYKMEIILSSSASPISKDNALLELTLSLTMLLSPSFPALRHLETIHLVYQAGRPNWGSLLLLSQDSLSYLSFSSLSGEDSVKTGTRVKNMYSHLRVPPVLVIATLSYVGFHHFFVCITTMPFFVTLCYVLSSQLVL